MTNGDELIKRILSGEKYFAKITLEDEALDQHPLFPELNAYLKAHLSANSPLIFERAQWVNVTAKGIYLPFLEGKSMVLNGVDLSEGDLSDANLPWATIYNSVLLGTNLKGADLEQVVFRNVDLSSANLSYSLLNHASVYGGDMDDLEDKFCNMSINDMLNANVQGFSAAELLSIRRLRAGLKSSGTPEKDIRDILEDHEKYLLKKREKSRIIRSEDEMLARAIEYGKEVSFNRANLESAELNACFFPGVDFRGAVLIDAWLEPVEGYAKARIDYADFEGADLTGAVMTEVRARGANFDQAKLGKAELNDADLRDSSFIGADIKETEFDGANLKGAKGIMRRV